MEQDQPLSTARMIIWSIIVVVGIFCLAAYTQPAPKKSVPMRQEPGHWMGLLYSPVDVRAVEHSSQLNVQISFSNAALRQQPGFACPSACKSSSLLSQLTSSNKPLVITFGH